MTDEIVQKVIEIVANETDVSKEQIMLGTSFVDLGVDSLDFLCILAEIRKSVGPVDNVFIDRIETVEDLAAAVGAKIETV